MGIDIRGAFKILFLYLTGFVSIICPAGLSAESNPEADKLWDFANGLFIRGNSFYPQAEQQYKEFLSKFPNDERADVATFRLAECYRLQNKYKEALETYLAHKKFQNSKNRDKADFRTGQVLILTGKPADAIAYLEPLSKKELPAELRDINLFYLGRAMIEAGRTEDGINVLKPVATDEKSAHRLFAAYYIASSSLKSGNLEQASQFFKPVSESKSSLAAESLFRLGEIFIKQNKLDEGRQYYTRLIETHPNSEYIPYAAYGILRAAFALQQYDECVKQYEKHSALLSNEVKAEVYYLVGNCHYEMSRFDKAIEFYLMIPKEFPDSPYAVKARYKSCYALYLLKKYEQVISYAETYIKQNPDIEDIDKLRFLAGDSYLALKNIDKAFAEFSIIVEKFPRSVFFKDSLFKLAWCLFEKKNYAEARKKFIEFAEKFPEHERAPEAIIRSAECSANLAGGEPASNKELAEQAVKDYEVFLQKYPQNPAREEVLFQLGIQYVELENADRAIATFQSLVDSFPDGKHSSDAYYWISREHQKKKEYDKTIPVLEKAISVSKEGKFTERSQYQLSAIYYERGDYDKAAEILLPLLAKNPEFEIPQQTHIWAAGYLREKGRLNEAIALYDKFIKKYNKSELVENAHFGIGECYFAQNKLPEAIANYKKSVELKGPSILEAKLALGISYVKSAKYDEAMPLLTDISKSLVPELEGKAIYWLGIALFEQAKTQKDERIRNEFLNKARLEFMKVEILYTNSETRPESMYRVAETFELAGETDEALKQYQKVVEAYPDNPYSMEAKKKIEVNKPQ